MKRSILPRILFLLLIALVPSSCQKGAAKASSTSAQSESQGEAAPIAATAEPPTTASMLAGDWVSTDDPSEGLTISDSSFAYTHGGKVEDEGSYLIGDAALTSKDGATNPYGKYITVFGEGQPISYYVVNLEADALSLSYVGRGNTLNYARPDLARALGPLMGQEYDSEGWGFAIEEKEGLPEFSFHGPAEAGGTLYQITGCAAKEDNDFVLTLNSDGDVSRVEIRLEDKTSARLTDLERFNWRMDKDRVFKLR